MDNHAAVKMGDLETSSEAIKLARPKFNKQISRTWSSGVDESTRRE